MSRVLAALMAGAAVLLSARQTIHNDTKRNFYEDELAVAAQPGNSTKAAESPLGPRLVVNGVTVRSTTGVEGFFRSVREAVYGSYTSTQEYLNEGKARIYEAERLVTGTVSALHDKREDLLPNAIYVVVAGLSGNILARRRGIVARTVAPIVLGLASFRYFLPQTFANTMGSAWAVEQRVAPELASGQVAALESAGNFVGRVEQLAQSGRNSVNSGIETARRKVTEWTGLNLDEEVSKK